jgi:HEAT repeat protein
VRGFDDLILEALDSNHEDMHYQAVCAAGNWEVDAAWAHIAALIIPDYDDKDLLLAAIEAVVNIRPQEASLLLQPFIGAEDDDISDAVSEALIMAKGLIGYDDDDDDDDEFF